MSVLNRRPVSEQHTCHEDAFDEEETKCEVKLQQKMYCRLKGKIAN